MNQITITMISHRRKVLLYFLIFKGFHEFDNGYICDRKYFVKNEIRFIFMLDYLV